MTTSFCSLVGVSALLVATVPACAQRGGAQAVRHYPDAGFELQVFDNSDSYSCVLDLNRHGHVIGVREASNPEGTIFSQKYWYSDGSDSVDLPLVEGYTNVVGEAISDTGLVVGFASRRIGHTDGSLIGFVWDSRTGKSTKLPPHGDDNASHAQDISADGTRISGYTTGANPARLRPCVWSWDAGSQSWHSTVLPTIEQYNPYLMSSRAVITPDGSRVAACVTERFLPDGTVDSSLYLWTYSDGQWQRSELSKQQMRLHGINDAGTMVGDLSLPTTRMPCRIDADGTVVELGFLPGDRSGEARGINNAGLIVGFTDDPGNHDAGPRAFVYENDQMRKLEMPPDTVYSAAYCVNDLGQIGGLADVTFPDETVEDPQTGEQQPVIKTVGFVRSPK
ncbi:MAG: hypothetical protein D6753_13535 [Planctomycetota bacterium]|nr:MAG: hypothetical protein D6753_13535 [Planctomycetota bacterium]